jgi:hypothetical protein
VEVRVARGNIWGLFAAPVGCLQHTSGGLSLRSGAAGFEKACHVARHIGIYAPPATPS